MPTQFTAYTDVPRVPAQRVGAENFRKKRLGRRRSRARGRRLRFRGGRRRLDGECIEIETRSLRGFTGPSAGLGGLDEMLSRFGPKWWCDLPRFVFSATTWAYQSCAILC